MNHLVDTNLDEVLIYIDQFKNHEFGLQPLKPKFYQQRIPKGFRLTERLIKKLHSLNVAFGGQYKTQENAVMIPLQGTGYALRNRTTKPENVASEMRELLSWYEGKCESSEFHPILLVGEFIYRFLKIHPFENGNGRVSRQLLNLMLQHHGYGFLKYASIEDTINERRDQGVAGQTRTDIHSRAFASKDRWLVFLCAILQVIVQRLHNKGQ